MEKDGGQLFEEEMSWIYETEDLVTLRPPARENYAWLEESLLKLCRGSRIVCVRKFSQPINDDE